MSKRDQEYWARRHAEDAKMAAMTPAERCQIEVGLQNLQYLLQRIPRAYQGPYFSAEDCASQPNADAFLARPDVQAALALANARV